MKWGWGDIIVYLVDEMTLTGRSIAFGFPYKYTNHMLTGQLVHCQLLSEDTRQNIQTAAQSKVQRINKI